MNVSASRQLPLMVRVGAAALAATASAGAAPITYHDFAADAASGITYRRQESTINAGLEAAKLLPFISLKELFAIPIKGHGQPGVAVWDYDNDGDEDVFVSNGPGRPHSLYQNQRVPTGAFTFVDVAAAAGVAAADQDGTGVCYGDVDNDGDEDLLVLGRMEPNRLFRNEGNGAFTDITAAAGVGGGARGHTSCTMGDVDNDGLLDIFVANTFDWARYEPVFNDPFAFNHANQFYHNEGGNAFVEASEAAGFHQLFNVPAGDATISWGAAFVDFDQDGDVDLMHADDQGAMPSSAFAGIDRGFNQTFKNDGAGNFVNVNATTGGLREVSAWMGLSYGDFNCDGIMDFFATSQGDYIAPFDGAAEPPGTQSSRWLLGSPSGDFVDSKTVGLGVNGLGATPFGWGTGAADYDNDGDTDVAFFGGLTVGVYQMADNPGVILKNNGCKAEFTWDEIATAEAAPRVIRQDVESLALGDLNDDGFVDLVYASGAYVPETIPLVQTTSLFGGVFDKTAFVLPQFIQIGPTEYEWSGQPTETDGYLGMQISSASNGNHWVKVKVKGAKGLAAGGKVNRDGIGAVVKFRPFLGKQVLSPVLGGSSAASQHSLTQTFGLKSAPFGTLEILWPGGARNRLYGVWHGERLTVPEIPCDFAGSWPSRSAYGACVSGALGELVANGTITSAMRFRLRDSALLAYDETH
jgi:hypothetical protein